MPTVYEIVIKVLYVMVGRGYKIHIRHCEVLRENSYS